MKNLSNIRDYVTFKQYNYSNNIVNYNKMKYKMTKSNL